MFLIILHCQINPLSKYLLFSLFHYHPKIL
nr:MAG TPA: hypothetical protein [Caudoviricetes sp.]